MKTQRNAILAHLKDGRSLTALEALDKFGSLRLAARVSELREEGYRISTTRVSVGRKRFARYRMS